MTPTPTPSPTATAAADAVREYSLNASQFGVLAVGLAVVLFFLAVIAVGVYRR